MLPISGMDHVFEKFLDLEPPVRSSLQESASSPGRFLVCLEWASKTTLVKAWK